MENKNGIYAGKIRKSRVNPKEICAKRLTELMPHIAPEDRRAAMDLFSKSYVTISRYVNGNVGNLVLGMKLLDFFTKQLNKRASELKILCRSQDE